MVPEEEVKDEETTEKPAQEVEPGQEQDGEEESKEGKGSGDEDDDEEEGPQLPLGLTGIQLHWLTWLKRRPITHECFTILLCVFGREVYTSCD